MQMSQVYSKAQLDSLGRVANAIEQSNPWWAQQQSGGLPFDCTACGKCCKNDGEVWFNTDEYVDLVEELQRQDSSGLMTQEYILQHYVEEVKQGWVRIKNRVIDSTIDDTDNAKKGECIFLGEDGKACGVYNVRPVQCRTYPWWPRLLTNATVWNSESVLPDDVEGGKHWSPESGGCEGLYTVSSVDGTHQSDNDQSKIVDTQTIYHNKALYETYSQAHPFLSNEQDVSRLKSKTSLILGSVVQSLFLSCACQW